MLVIAGIFLPSWEVVLLAGMLAQSLCLTVAALRLLPRFFVKLLVFAPCWTEEVRRFIPSR